MSETDWLNPKNIHGMAAIHRGIGPEPTEPETPADRLAAYLDEYTPEDPESCPAAEDIAEAAPWLLIEAGRYGNYWFTLHGNARDALRYNELQEYAEDWSPRVWANLLTGEEEEYPALGQLALEEERAPLAGVMIRYAEWERNRRLITEMEEQGETPDADAWECSDDEAVVLLREVMQGVGYVAEVS